MSQIPRRTWQQNFREWYRNALSNAEIMDFRYPIKGCGVWLPYGFKLRKNVLDVIRRLLDETGHEEALFPLLIPRKMIEMESEHIAKLEDQVYWVTKGGARRLGVDLALRPTSETAVAPMLKIWIRSHRDLPKKLYQVVNIFRYETKATVPILRVREVMTFKEAHTAHATPKEAEEQVNEGVDIYKRFFGEIGVPYIVSKRPVWDKFPGADYSIAFDLICPDGRALQIGTVHNLGQNFSRVFDISFETADGGREHVYQTCYGISGRAIASIIIAHGDDRGPVIPPNVAPIQVVIVPIPYKGYEKREEEFCRRVAESLREAGMRVEVDVRDKVTPGSKFYHWETRGVPIRIEIGPKDVDERRVTIVRRDTLGETRTPIENVVSAVAVVESEATERLRRRAWDWMESRIKKAASIEEVKTMLDEGCVAETGWCGDEECGLHIEEAAEASVLGEALGKEPEGKCLVCAKKAKNVIRIARAY